MHPHRTDGLRGQLLAAFSLLAVAIAPFGCAPKPSPAPASPNPVLARPNDALRDLNNQPFDLWRTPPAAAIVCIFTRTDCPISNRFAPEVRRLCATYQPRGVEFFLVYVDPAEAPESIARHLREYDYPCRALRDPTHALVSASGATITPEAILLDANRSLLYRGRINDLYLDVGKPRPQATTRDLADAIEASLAGRPAPAPRTRAVGCLIADLVP